MQEGRGHDPRRLALPGTSLSEGRQLRRGQRSEASSPLARPRRRLVLSREGSSSSPREKVGSHRVHGGNSDREDEDRGAGDDDRVAPLLPVRPAVSDVVFAARRPPTSLLLSSSFADTALKEEVARFVDDRREILLAWVVRRDWFDPTGQPVGQRRRRPGQRGLAGTVKVTSRRSGWLRPSTSCAPSENGPASAMGSSASTRCFSAIGLRASNSSVFSSEGFPTAVTASSSSRSRSSWLAATARH
jgi:hypothetical protein